MEFIIRRNDWYEENCTADGYFRNEPSEFEKRALKNAKGHILDVGCGPGAGILWLQDQGDIYFIIKKMKKKEDIKDR